MYCSFKIQCTHYLCLSQEQIMSNLLLLKNKSKNQIETVQTLITLGVLDIQIIIIIF